MNGRRGSRRKARSRQNPAYRPAGILFVHASSWLRAHDNIRTMQLDDAISILRHHETELRARGVRRAAIFGSVASNRSGPESDVDVLIDLDPGSALDAFAYAGLKSFVASLFNGPVDVINRGGLKPHIKAPAERNAVYAF